MQVYKLIEEWLSEFLLNSEENEFWIEIQILRWIKCYTWIWSRKHK